MDVLFSLLFFASIIALIVGLIKPTVFSRFLKERATRKGTAAIFGMAAIALFFLVGLTVDTSSPNHRANNTQDTNTTSAIEQKVQQPAESAKSVSEENQIRGIISNVLKGNNNMDQPRLRKIEVVKQVNGGWGVFVDYNSSDNFTADWRKTGIEITMSEIYIALYTSSKDIQSASVAAYFPLLDKYGNEHQGVVYKSILNKSEADKVNWRLDSSTLELSILPNVWTTTVLHREFR